MMFQGGDLVLDNSLMYDVLSHGIRVSKILNALGVSYEAAKCHDLGKLSIPRNILAKDGSLNGYETAIMQTHTIKIREYISLMRSFGFSNSIIQEALEIAQYHHEKWDGSGYPEGLEGEQIPHNARLTKIADVYDALRSRRSYKEPLSHKKSLEIMDNIREEFDPKLFDMFIRNHEDIKTAWIHFEESPYSKGLESRLPPSQPIFSGYNQVAAQIGSGPLSSYQG